VDATAGSTDVSGPYTVTTDSAGRIWEVADEHGPTILAFDASGHSQWVRSVQSGGSVWPSLARVDGTGEIYSATCWGDVADDGGWVDDPVLYKFSASGSPSWSPPVAIPRDIWGQLDQTAQTWWPGGWPGGRLAVDPSGNALVSSAFVDAGDFGAAGKLTSAGGLDAVVLRYDGQGQLHEAARWGGADDDLPVDLTVDPAGNAVIAGWTKPPELDGVYGEAGSHFGAFVAKVGW
jgi:hypothetical protein